MKNLFKVCLVVAILLLTCTSCVDEEKAAIVKSSKFHSYTIEKVEFEGHSYLILDASYRAGICHDENCPCRKSQESNL